MSGSLKSPGCVLQRFFLIFFFEVRNKEMKCTNNEEVKIVLAVLLSISFAISGWGKHLTFKKLGEDVQRIYSDVCLDGNYAYCAASEAGVDILSITDPTNPVHVANIVTPRNANGVAVKGDYAYIAEEDGLLVVDITNPNKPVWKGHLRLPGSADSAVIRVVDNNVYLAGNYSKNEGRMDIVDVSTPSAPFMAGQYRVKYPIEDLIIAGGFAYLSTYDGDDYAEEASLHIIDISNPALPNRIGDFTGFEKFNDLQISGKYLYIAHYYYSSYDDYYELLILDISRAKTPKKVSETRVSGGVDTIVLSSDGKYAYLTDGSSSWHGGMSVVDISNPSSPLEVNNIDDISAEEIAIKDGYIYAVNPGEGLKTYNISNPLTPTPSGISAASGLGWPYLMAVKGNYAYVFDRDSIGDRCDMFIYDISVPTHPVVKKIHHFGMSINDIKLSGNYTYLTAVRQGLMVLDFSNPTNPVEVGNYPLGTPSLGPSSNIVFLNGNYTYITTTTYITSAKGGLYIIDISNPTSPTLAGNWNCGDDNSDMWGILVRGNYAYIADSIQGLFILDIGNPANPTLLYNDPSLNCSVVDIKDDYLYINNNEDLNIYNISDPTAPHLVKTIPKFEMMSINQELAFVSNFTDFASPTDITVYNISDLPGTADLPVLGKFHNQTHITAFHVVNNLIYVGSERRFSILEFSEASALPQIHLNPTMLNFTCDYAGQHVASQSFAITNRGGGNLDWTLSGSQDWLQFTPACGNTDQEVFASVDNESLAAGIYQGKITVSSRLAPNAPQEVTVTLTVKAGKPEPGVEFPFGSFDTPVDGSWVARCIPVTGWALDDTGVESVQLYRAEGNSMAFIGNASFVEGARPDITDAFPGYPNCTKAGWGYMLLTNLLPEGDGQYTIYAIAIDYDGNSTTLGSKTITVSNAYNREPFGALDTPAEGGIAQGSQYVNFGWALSPQPNTIPPDGSTITVWVDGVFLGHPEYNQYRSDIAQLFPGYNNTEGAGGYVYLDTTKYDNGVHTIQWSVKDDTGNTEGIGSRYFTIQNSESTLIQSGPSAGNSIAPVLAPPGEKTPMRPRQEDDWHIPEDVIEPVWVKTGYALDTGAIAVNTGKTGAVEITIPEVERLEVGFAGPVEPLGCLPIGSFLDRTGGIFYWQPGAGVLGTHRLVFKTVDSSGRQCKKTLLITIKPAS
jgi:hypothetical protein